MSVLPIVDRELRVAARRTGTYRMRFWAASCMLGVWLILLTSSRLSSPGQLGRLLLNALGVLAFTFSLLAGVFLTSDCLSEEKREGTLGLLFLTDLKAYDVVLGKLVANSLHAFFGLLAILPILGLALLAGGVTGGEFWRLGLVFMVTLFFSLSVGMAVSALTSEAKQAMFSTLLIIGVLTGILPSLWWLQWLSARWSALDFLLWPSPAYAYMNAFDSRYRLFKGPQEFWLSLGTVLVLGCAGIVLANVVLPRSWRQGNAECSTQGKFKWPGSLPRGARRRYRLGNWSADPMYWLAARDTSPQLLVRRALLLLVPVWLIAFVAGLVGSGKNEFFTISLFTSYGLHLIVKTLVASEASRRMNEDRRSGAWELLLVTPLRVGAILEGQAGALRRHFRGAIATLWVVNASMLAAVGCIPQAFGMGSQDKMMFSWIFFLGGIVLPIDFYALSWVGMWRGLKARKHPRAVLETVAQIILPPVAVIFLLVFIRPNVGGINAAMVVMFFWFLAGVGLDCISVIVAREHLLTEFRSAALERFQA